MVGVLVGIDKLNNQSLYRVILYRHKELTNEWQFKKEIFSEENLYRAMTNGLMLRNATVRDGKVIARTGSFDRFGSGNGFKPYIIISVIIGNDITVGYKIADYDFNVKNIKLEQMLDFCYLAYKRDLIPLQNAMYVNDVGKAGIIRCYPDGEFVKETISIKKKADKSVEKVDDKIRGKPEKSSINTSSIDASLFTELQLRELAQAMTDIGDKCKILYDPKLSPEKMKLLREAMKSGLSVNGLVDPRIDIATLRMYLADLSYGVDISKYLDYRYSIEQINELSIGYLDGLDISQYSDYKLTAEEMAERRIRLESKIWMAHEVKDTFE